MVRLRLAASPTGYPHIGTIYQALFDYAYAKKSGGEFIVRIEDTDRSRFVEGSEDVIFHSIDWFGLIEEESPRKGGRYAPYRQSERLNIYHEYAQKLLENGKAYFDYYKKEEVGGKKDYSKKESKDVKIQDSALQTPISVKEMLEKKDWVLRMKIPQDTKIKIKDGIRGEIEFDSGQITEQVLLKSDGFPTYHLASVVDDHLMKITHVVRAEEWITSTPKHFLLYEYFGWEKPLFFHTPTLRNPDKSKLSKRHGHTDIRWYQKAGFLPEAVLNFLALMGWSHPEEKEIFPLPEFIKLFDLKDVKPVGPIFDLTKLKWMNQHYIQNLTEGELKEKIKEFFPKSNKLKAETLDSLIPIIKSRMETLTDFEKLTGVFFDEIKQQDFDQEENQIAESLCIELSKIKDWKSEAIFNIIKGIMLKRKIRMPVFYKIFTGEERGLPLPETLEILGKEKSIRRLEEVARK